MSGYDFDTDAIDNGLTNWAADQNTRLANARAELAAAGNVATFPVLVTLDGVKVRAVLRDSKFRGGGRYWMMLDSDGKPTGEYHGAAYGWLELADTATRQERAGRARAIARLEAAGYREATEERRAIAKFGKGASVGSPLPIEIVDPETFERARWR